MKILLGVEENHLIQSTDYSCGPACAAIILRYYGYKGKEKQLIKKLGADPSTGVEPQTLVKFFRTKKFHIKQKHKATIKIIEQYIDKGWPIIVCYQDHSIKPSETDYSISLDHGHYAIINGYDEEKFWFVDPSSKKPNKSLSKEEFVSRWRDITTKFKFYHKWMLAIGPKKKRNI